MPRRDINSDSAYSDDALRLWHWRNEPSSAEIPVLSLASAEHFRAAIDALLDSREAMLDTPGKAELPAEVATKVGDQGAALLYARIREKSLIVDIFRSTKGAGFFLLLGLPTVLFLWFAFFDMNQFQSPLSVLLTLALSGVILFPIGYLCYQYFTDHLSTSGYRIWLFRHTIVVHSNGMAYFSPWRKVAEFLVRSSWLWIQFGIRDGSGTTRAWFTILNTQSNRRSVNTLEIAAACEKIADAIRELEMGRYVSFGRWWMGAYALVDRTEPILWQNIDAVKSDDESIELHSAKRGKIIIRRSEVPFPSLFVALARGLIAHWSDEFLLSRENRSS